MSDNTLKTRLTEGQSSKEITINAIFDELDAALTETSSLTAAAGNISITDDDLSKQVRIKITNVTVAGRTVTLEPIKKLLIVASDAANTQPFDLIVGTTTLVIDPDTHSLVYLDGTANGLTLISSGGSGGGVSVLDDLTDVDTTGVTTNDVLTYNGTDWSPAPIPAGVSALDDLSDVSTTGAATNDVLTYNGSSWAPAAPSGGGGGGALVEYTGAMNAPAHTTFTKVNDGGTWTYNNTSRGHTIHCDTSNTALGYVTYPASGNFMAKLFIVNNGMAQRYGRIGMHWGDNTNKHSFIGVQFNGGPGLLQCRRYTNVDTYDSVNIDGSGGLTGSISPGFRGLWFGIKRTGTTLDCGMSLDGENFFYVVESQSESAWTTPTRIGWEWKIDEVYRKGLNAHIMHWEIV